jgi:hypothetical protein
MAGKHLTRLTEGKCTTRLTAGNCMTHPTMRKRTTRQMSVNFLRTNVSTALPRVSALP